MKLKFKSIVSLLLLIGLLLYLLYSAYGFYTHFLLPSLIATTSYSDFASYYFPAQALTKGLNFYDIKEIIPLAKNIIPYSQDMGSYLYPPLFLLLLTPLTIVSFAKAKMVWTIINLCFAVLLWHELYRYCQKKYYLFLLFSIALLNYFSLGRVFTYGQVEIIILYCLLLSLRMHLNNKKWLPGIILGVISALKLYPLFFIGYYLIKKQYKTASIAAITFTILFTGSLIFLPTSTSKYYLTNIVPKLVTGQASQQYVEGKISYAGTKYWPGNHSLSGLLAHTLTKQNVTQGFIYQPLLSQWLGYILSLLLVCLAIKSIIGQKNEYLNFSLWLIVFLIINPLTWEHYLVLVWPALLFLILDWYKEKKSVQYFGWGGLIIIYYILSYNIYYWYPVMRSSVGTLLISIKAIALIILYLIFLLYFHYLTKNKK